LASPDPNHDAESLFLEHLERQKRGESVDWEALYAQHPQLAEELREQKRLWDAYGALVSEAPNEGALASGRVIAGKYELVRKLGGGGFGQVWLAKQLPSGQKVALKLAHTDEVDPDRAAELRRRLFNDAVAMGRSKHPGIVVLLDSGSDGQTAWMAMEYVEGSDLRQGLVETIALQERGELPSDYDKGVATLVAKVCEAMQAAHDAGVIHRDLKPDNIMVADAEPKVTDFGLARMEDLSLSRTGSIAGTYYYMSPEQLKQVLSNNIDSRTDIFSLGAVLYELVALRKPFQGDTREQLSVQILSHDAVDPRTLRSKAAPELCIIAAKAMEKDREHRYQTMREFGDDLRRFVADEPIHAQPPTPVQRLRKWMRRHPVAASVIGVASVAALAISTLAVFLYYAERRSEERRARLATTYGAAELQLLQQEALTLGAGVPENIPQLEGWIQRAERLMAGEVTADGAGDSLAFTEQQAQLGALRRAADETLVVDPETDEDLQSALNWRAVLEAELTWTRRMAGVEPFPTADASLARLRLEGTLTDRIWSSDRGLLDLIDGLAPVGPPNLNESPKGEETAALALLERADELARERNDSALLLELVIRRCWLLVQVGQLDKVPAAVERSLALLALASTKTPEERWSYELFVQQALLEARVWRERMPLLSARIGQLEQDLAELDKEVQVRAQNSRFLASPETQEWHDALRAWIADMHRFRTGFVEGKAGPGVDLYGVPNVPERLAQARAIDARIASPEGVAVWSAATEAIKVSPLYANARWPGRRGFVVQRGLWPLGADPISGLHEFAHLGSGTVPTRATDGQLKLTADSAIVLVLLPGGAVSATYDEPLGDMSPKEEGEQTAFDLAPFFLGKYEVTQGQWRRIRYTDLSSLRPDMYAPPSSMTADVALQLPLDSVSWTAASDGLGAAALSLPSEIQWHYGSFGAAQSKFPWGEEEAVLEGKANISDQARRNDPGENLEKDESHARWNDGWARTAPVGRFAPNGFGLHDVAGNLAEWCSDGRTTPDPSGSVAPYWDPNTGARSGGVLKNPAVKGGHYAASSDQCRRGDPQYAHPGSSEPTNGVRAARKVLP